MSSRRGGERLRLLRIHTVQCQQLHQRSPVNHGKGLQTIDVRQNPFALDVAKAALRQPVFWIVVLMNQLKAGNLYISQCESQLFAQGTKFLSRQHASDPLSKM